MAIRTNTNPRSLALPAELQNILQRNGMTAQVVGSSEGFALIVQGHDSPLLTYPITEKQLKALTDWGTNSANKKAYNTFASIVASDFDMPIDFVHARNANGRVAMGLHGVRIGVGEYGRTSPDRSYHESHIPPMYGRSPFMPIGNRWPHMMGCSFLGWTPRQQEGWHMRRIGGQLYYPGAPMVPTRPDGKLKPGELHQGGYGFYYKQTATAQAAPADVLADLQTVIQPMQPKRQEVDAKPYKEMITSDVYFSAEKWQECLESHGIVIDEKGKTMTIQSASLDADLQYALLDSELASIMNPDLKAVSKQQRLDIMNDVIKDDFNGKITMEMLNSKKQIDIPLHPDVMEDLNQQLRVQNDYYQQATIQPEISPLRHELQEGAVLMNGNDLAYINPDKGWYREGRHGREVSVEDIRVEPIPEEKGKFRMSAVIDGKVISHEITQKQYDKFMTVDDYHRMKLFSKIFKEVDMKDRYPVGLGTQIFASLAAGLAATDMVLHGGFRPAPDIYMDCHRGPAPKVYFKPGVDTPADVAARQFDAMINDPNAHRGPAMGM